MGVVAKSVHSAAKSWAGSRARASLRKERAKASEGRCGQRPALPAKGSPWAWPGAAGLWESGVLGSHLLSPPAMSEAGWPCSPARGTTDRFLELIMSLPVSSLHWHPAQLTLRSSESSQ